MNIFGVILLGLVVVGLAVAAFIVAVIHYRKSGGPAQKIAVTAHLALLLSVLSVLAVFGRYVARDGDTLMIILTILIGAALVCLSIVAPVYRGREKQRSSRVD